MIDQKTCEVINSAFKLSERQENILRHLLSAYVKTAQPVASKDLAEAIGCSSATIRSELGILTEMDLVYAPHTSAGRAPTAKAFRWLVNSLNQVNNSGDFTFNPKPSILPRAEIQQWNKIAEELKANDHKLNPDQKPRILARVASAVAGAAAMFVYRQDIFYYTGLSSVFAQPEFSDWSKVQEVSKVMDNLERALTEFSRLPETQYPPWPNIQVKIGREYFDSDDFSLLVTSFGPGSRFALFGPVRQDYPAQIERLLRIRTLLL